MSADIKKMEGKYMEMKQQWTDEGDAGKKEGLMKKMNDLEMNAYKMMGECRKGDITYCQKNENCGGQTKCFEIAKDYFMEDADECNNFKGGCVCHKFDAEKDKKEKEGMPRPPGFTDDEWTLV